MSVLVWIETFKGAPVPTSWEALGAGKLIADALGGGVTALVFGENAGEVAQQAAQYGATKVLTCDDATLKEYRLEAYAALLTKLVQEHKPKAVVAVGTSRARELLAASAADTDSGLLTDVTELHPEGETLKVIRPVYAGKLLSDAASVPGGTTFVLLRGRAFKPNEVNAGASAEITSVAPALSEDQIATKVESFEEEVGKVNLQRLSSVVGVRWRTIPKMRLQASLGMLPLSGRRRTALKTPSSR
jgi:electron transfer flavoprotein alpha subunit